MQCCQPEQLAKLFSSPFHANQRDLSEMEMARELWNGFFKFTVFICPQNEPLWLQILKEKKWKKEPRRPGLCRLRAACSEEKTELRTGRNSAREMTLTFAVSQSAIQVCSRIAARFWTEREWNGQYMSSGRNSRQFDTSGASFVVFIIIKMKILKFWWNWQQAVSWTPHDPSAKPAAQRWAVTYGCRRWRYRVL